MKRSKFSLVVAMPDRAGQAPASCAPAALDSVAQRQAASVVLQQPQQRQEPSGIAVHRTNETVVRQLGNYGVFSPRPTRTLVRPVLRETAIALPQVSAPCIEGRPSAVDSLRMPLLPAQHAPTSFAAVSHTKPVMSNGNSTSSVADRVEGGAVASYGGAFVRLSSLKAAGLTRQSPTEAVLQPAQRGALRHAERTRDEGKILPVGDPGSTVVGLSNQAPRNQVTRRRRIGSAPQRTTRRRVPSAKSSATRPRRALQAHDEAQERAGTTAVTTTPARRSLRLDVDSKGEPYAAGWSTQKGRRILRYHGRRYTGSDAHEIWEMIRAWCVANNRAMPSSQKRQRKSACRQPIAKRSSSRGKARGTPSQPRHVSGGKRLFRRAKKPQQNAIEDVKPLSEPSSVSTPKEGAESCNVDSSTSTSSSDDEDIWEDSFFTLSSHTNSPGSSSMPMNDNSDCGAISVSKNDRTRADSSSGAISQLLLGTHNSMVREERSSPVKRKRNRQGALMLVDAESPGECTASALTHQTYRAMPPPPPPLLPPVVFEPAARSESPTPPGTQPAPRGVFTIVGGRGFTGGTNNNNNNFTTSRGGGSASLLSFNRFEEDSGILDNMELGESYGVGAMTSHF